MRSVAGALLACLLAAHLVAAAEPTTGSVPAPQAIAPSTAPAAAVPSADAPPAELRASLAATPDAAMAPVVDLNFANLQRRLAARLARPSYEVRSRFGPPAAETNGFGVQVERNCGR